MCDMDERDWTSLESSSVSIVDCSGDEELMVSFEKQGILKVGQNYEHVDKI